MPPVTVSEATPADLASVRAMLHEYAAWLAIDLSFQDFAKEVRDLPGDYAPPGGALYIARLGDETVGMVAFRTSAAGGAEMKRLFVRPSARGSGVGRALIEQVIERARAAGHARMILDTLPVMRDAQRLYEQFGFRDVAPYYDSPVAGTRFMARAL
jgi:putative acetyltransferase